MNDPIFISYATPGGYADDQKLLKLSLKTLGLEYDMRVFADGDGMEEWSAVNWNKRTHYKPTFIRQMMEEHPGRPLVYLDADCFVRQKPVLFWAITEDFAAHIFPPGDMLLSGTVYFSGGLMCRRVVESWIFACEFQPTVWDQILLKNEIKRHRASFQMLPYSYCEMVGGQGMTSVQLPNDNPVIIHTRGSFRHGIEGHDEQV